MIGHFLVAEVILVSKSKKFGRYHFKTQLNSLYLMLRFTILLSYNLLYHRRKKYTLKLSKEKPSVLLKLILPVQFLVALFACLELCP